MKETLSTKQWVLTGAIEAPGSLIMFAIMKVAAMLRQIADRMLMGRGGIALIVVSLGATSADAQEEELLSASEAMEAVASNERLELHLQEAEPTQAELIYVLEEGTYVPRYWLVLLTGAEEPAGVVGIDPFTGALGIEYTVEEEYTFPQFAPARWQESLADHGIEPERYNFDQARLVWLGGMVKANTWVVPQVEDEREASIVITAFPRQLEYLSAEPQYQTERGHLVYELGELLPETRRSDWAMTEEDPDFEPDEAQEVTPVAEQQLSMQAASTGAARTDKQLVGDVPFYHQGTTQWCALFALSMLHQWWSPTSIDTGRGQAQEQANFLGHGTDEGTAVSEMKDIINQWDIIDQNYQDFRTTYVGTGEHPIQDGLRDGETDEIKSMITHMDTPVAALVDSDGGGRDDVVDHVVLVTGYDDQTDKLFIHNSGATLGNPNAAAGNAVSYSDWNNKYWNAKWWDVPVFNKNDERYGIVTGYPGDMNYIKLSSVTPDPATSLFSDITDDERASIKDIGLSIAQDDAKEGQDAFGESYETTVLLKRTGPEFAEPTNVSSGDFDQAGPPTLTFRHNSGLQKGNTLAGGSVDWDPAIQNGIWNLGDVGLEFTYTAHDREDRHHYYGRKVTVFDDRGPGTGNTMQMPKPVLLRAREQFTQSFTVKDDDDSGPLVTNPQPTTSSISDNNWPSGTLTVRADVTDPSGVAEVKFHHEVFDSNGTRASGSGPPSSQSGSTYGWDISDSQWAQPGRKIEWWVEATDDDQDGGSTADRASSTSPKFSIRFYDDDTEAPTVIDRSSTAKDVTVNGQKKVEYRLKFKLEDPKTSGSVSSGIRNSSTLPKVYVRWGNSTVTADKHDRSFTPGKNGDWFVTQTFTAPLARRNETLHWAVEAQDTDTDRPNDRSSATLGPFQLRLSPKLSITPNPPDHDFGVNADGSWSFTVENQGGGNLKLWGEVDGPLQRVKPSGSSIPNCKLYENNDRCWLSLSGLNPLTGQNTSPLVVSGGTSQDISINVNYRGFSHQVTDLPPGDYEAPIKIWDNVKHQQDQGPLNATIKFSVPSLNVTSPQKDDVVSKETSQTITWSSSFIESSEKVKIELVGATTTVIAKATKNDGSHTWQVPKSTNNGQHRIEIRPVELPSVTAKSAPFDIGSIPPDRPTNQSPSDGTIGIPDDLTLSASSFVDPNEGDSHQKSQWQIRTDEAGNVDPLVYGTPSTREPAPVWTTTESGTGDLTSIQVPHGTLPRYKAERSFTVRATQNGPVSPDGEVLEEIEVKQCQQVTIELDNPSSSSAKYRLVFQYGGDHISKWVDPGKSDVLSFRADQRGSTQWSLQRQVGQERSVVGEATFNVENAKYWWHVRYQDDKGEWSKWSKETSLCALKDDGASRVVRILPSELQPGSTFLVEIEVTPTSGVSSYALEEKPPEGWTVSEIDEGGSFDAQDGLVKWDQFLDNQARRLSYSLEVPPDASGSASFQGSGSFDGQNVLIEGDQEMVIESDRKTPGILITDNTKEFDGDPKRVSVVTNPEGLSTTVTYDGESTAPSAVGSYKVEVTASNENYKGTATGTLQIVKGDQEITFPPIGNKTLDNSPFEADVSATSGLRVTLSVLTGPASVDGTTVALDGTGEVTLEATQAGNENWNAAEPVLRSFKVAGPGRVRPELSIGLSADGTSVNLTVDGDAGSTFIIERATSLSDPQWEQVGTVSDTESVDVTNDDAGYFRTRISR